MREAGPDLKGRRITVMGLGLHGGGLASAHFCARHGAIVTVTDLKTENDLGPSLEKLEYGGIRLVLGKHEIEDFSRADMVIKNPGVPRTSVYLQAAKRIETDISLFLQYSENPIIAVTGSKGKSTTVSAVHHCLRWTGCESFLGGNITASPLGFLHELPPHAPVVLELSSFQLGDLPLTGTYAAGRRLRPAVSMITNIYPDHQNYYHSMSDYVKDKKLIFKDQQQGGGSIFNYDQDYGREFAAERGRNSLFISSRPLPSDIPGAFLDGDAGFLSSVPGIPVLPETLLVPGRHNRRNLLAAALAVHRHTGRIEGLSSALAGFPGIPHRLEHVRRIDGIDFYNDSAATIPQATVEAIESFSRPVRLITGGTDKMLDFTGIGQACASCAGIYLLEGSATELLIQELRNRKLPFSGPFPSLQDCLSTARTHAHKGDIVLFSPGSASFELFANEFDRGDRYKAIVKKIEKI